MVSRRTALGIVTNLHNPSGGRIDEGTLAEMARILARVGGDAPGGRGVSRVPLHRLNVSSVHAGANVIATNSLTKAYGLDGLRAGWMLGPPALIRRGMLIDDLLGNNGVAVGEQLTLRAFERLERSARARSGCSFQTWRGLRRFLSREPRLRAFVPEGGNVVFPRLPAGLDGDRLAAHLLREYSTLVVPGRFFESPRHIRFSFGTAGRRLARGLDNIGRALDELCAA